MRCDVSTFPADTARGGLALTTLPSGATTRTGTMQPWFAGTASPAMQRTT